MMHSLCPQLPRTIHPRAAKLHSRVSEEGSEHLEPGLLGPSATCAPAIASVQGSIKAVPSSVFFTKLLPKL